MIKIKNDLKYPFLLYRILLTPSIFYFIILSINSSIKKIETNISTIKTIVSPPTY